MQRPQGRAHLVYGSMVMVTSAGELHVDKVKDHSKNLVFHSEQKRSQWKGMSRKLM